MNDWTELKRLAEEATPGPWEISEDSAGGRDELYCYWHRIGPIEIPGISADKNGLFIAAANPKTILALIAENERLQLIVEASEEVERQLQQNSDVERIRADNWRDDSMAWADRCIASEAERDQLRAEVEALRELLRDSCEAIRHGEFSTGICCCGSSVDSHGFGDGHSPVDEGDYYASGLIERIDSALKANQ